MKIAKLKTENLNLPDAPGVYYFLAPSTKSLAPRVLYIGKATSLEDRVKSYFSHDLMLTRGHKVLKMIEEATKVDYIQTDSVLEALILEANEIKKHQPVYNSIQKDDKSYNYVVITKEPFPKVLIKRGRDLESGDMIYHITFGPFPNSGELREALKIVRKIFPYSDKCTPCNLQRSSASGLHKSAGCKPCFNAQIGLCPGSCADWITKGEYKNTIRHIKLFFDGKKEKLIKNLEKEMQTLAKSQKFEKADKIKRKIFALDHIQDIALIKQDLGFRNHDLGMRIEAYDIAHLSGKDVVGVMTVVEDGERAPSQYRKFKINPSIRAKLGTGQGNDDTGNLKEILTRRFGHPEWRTPNLIVVDGGVGQMNTAKKVLKELGLKINVVAVTKNEQHKPKEIIPKSRILNPKSERAILLANAEAHRFSIGYHRKLRSKGFRI